ncbi:FtsH protease activity modulator HflK [Pseudomarimonas arenosa]|uniref:Protein HflK n=1 Tax=Pseudomarimonas arenosa TaxID=2774145 RepID=A0AAW3ZL89_9GAMM|nr:FtsH protease activity modulator HflK [Pseudomarimonas arenosa]MBD8525685.1 FtsH protease activity modulator HflK [Pseudomarimonas arenosa]
MSNSGIQITDLFGKRRGNKPPSAGDAKSYYFLAVIVLGVVGLWLVLSMYYTVQPEERAVVKRFGAVIKIADPGLHFKAPFGIDDVEFVATERVLKQEFGFRTAGLEGDRTQYNTQGFLDESLMLSGDLNMVDVEWVVQFRIADPMKFLYGMREPIRALRDISESVMRRAVGNRLGSEVLTTARVEISNIARDEIQQAMERYDTGIQVVTVELQDVVPPAAVQPAFNEVNEARQERERMINEATKQANQVIPRAKGEAARTIAEAEGYANERVNGALGETARFRSIIAEYRQAPEVTRTRMFLETIDQVIPKVGSVVVVESGGGSPLPLLRLRDAQPNKEKQQ